MQSTTGTEGSSQIILSGAPYDLGRRHGELRPNGDRVTYTWDIENHLTRVELPGSVVNTFTLDADGKRRTIQDTQSGLRKIIWDAENILAEIDTNNATLYRYTLEPDIYGNLVSERYASQLSAFHHFDALGSTAQLTAANAGLITSYLYRAFGQQSSSGGTWPTPFTWVGRLGYYRQPDAGDHHRGSTSNPSFCAAAHRRRSRQTNPQPDGEPSAQTSAAASCKASAARSSCTRSRRQAICRSAAVGCTSYAALASFSISRSSLEAARSSTFASRRSRLTAETASTLVPHHTARLPSATSSALSSSVAC
jgi:hypothetical protein